MNRVRNFVVLHKWIIIGAVVGVLLLLTPSYYFYQKYQNLELMLKNPSAAARGGLDGLVKKVNAHIALPKDEVPEVATVSNKEKLTNLDFFKKAQNGDKVLLYKKSKTAYLYRPATDQLINVAPIIDPGAAVGDTAGVSSRSAAVSPQPASATVLNATATAGYARKIKDQIQAAHANITVTKTGNATGDYKKTTIVDFSGKNKALADSLAKELGGEVQPNATAEAKVTTDLLIIAVK